MDSKTQGNGIVKVGVLAIQGDYQAHARVLERLGVDAVEIRKPADMDGVRGVILPGGESTTHLKILREGGLFSRLKEFAAGGGAFFGTCAGAILLAKQVRGPVQDSLGALNIGILRNGYGRQISSDVRYGKTKLREEPLEMVFIRAPIIEKVGPDVEVLAECENLPVLVQQGAVLAATFHPELTTDSSLHEYFLGLVRRSS